MKHKHFLFLLTILAVSLSWFTASAIESDMVYERLWIVPAPDTSDYMDLFRDPDAWDQVRGRAEVFGVYDYVVLPPAIGGSLTLNDVEVNEMVTKVNQWGLDFEFETGAIKEWGGKKADDTFGVTFSTIQNLKATHNRSVQYILMDEPFFAAKAFFATPMDTNDMVDVVAEYIGLIKQKDPNILVGDTEPFPAFSAQEFIGFLARYKERTGAHFDFVALDAAREQDGFNVIGIAEIKKYCEDEGIPLCMELWGSGWFTTDKEFYDDVLDRAKQMYDYTGVWEIANIQKWDTYETNALPEDANYSLTQAAKDISAYYLYGFTAKASMPIPADSASDTGIEVELMWARGQNTSLSTLYFGTDSTPDAGELVGNQEGITFNPGPLNANTTYYWRVDAVDGAGTTTGDVWSFDTGIEANLVAWYKLDESSGSTAADSSGNGHDGTMSGSTWDATGGKFGGTVVFDGDGYVSVPASVFSGITNEVTIALWQYGDTTDQPSNDVVFNASGDKLQAHVPWSDGTVYFYAPASDEVYKAASTSEYEGQWNHWAFTKNSTTDVMIIYLNGQEWTYGVSMTGSISDITLFNIGSHVDGSSYAYHGKIDDFRIYDAELSADDINDIYELSNGLKASLPTPATAATGVDPDVTLRWRKGRYAAGAGSHEVYLGTSSAAVTNATTASNQYMGAEEYWKYSPSGLTWNTTYYWRVDEVDDTTTYKGDTWSFTTEASAAVWPVAWYKFDESSGTTAYDSSRNGHDATRSGAAWNATGGKFGGALDCDGDGYVSVPSSVFSGISNEVTIALWQYGDAATQPADEEIFNANDYKLNAHIPWSDGYVYFEAPRPDEIKKAASTSDYEGQWNHWAFTKNASTGYMRIYLNGVEWQSLSSKTNTMSGITAFAIGSDSTGTAYKYHGLIDDFRIYDDELTAAQIAAVYAEGGGGKSTSPSPADDATSVSREPTLSWTAGPFAAATDGHDIYLSLTEAAVRDADSSDQSGTFKGSLSTNSYNPGSNDLEWERTYYWRVDDVNGSNVYKGDVWSFTVDSSDANLMAWWKFDEGSGDFVVDYSGYNHFGKIIDVNWSANGQIGGAVSFEDDDNTYVALNANVFNRVDDQLTITLWQNGDTAAQPANDDWIFFASYPEISVRLPASDGDVYWITDTEDINQPASASEYEGQWNHWAFTKDSTAGEMKIYLNGVLWHSGTDKYQAIPHPGWVMVGNHSALTYPYSGLVDEIRIYNKVLDVNDINDIYEAGL